MFGRPSAIRQISPGSFERTWRSKRSNSRRKASRARKPRWRRGAGSETWSKAKSASMNPAAGSGWSSFGKTSVFAFRQLAHSKGFTAVALLTLALGIGANTAVFTLVHAVMLQSLPVANPSQLYRLGDTTDCCVIGGHQERFSIYSYPLYRYLRDHTPEFEEMAAFGAQPGPFSVRRRRHTSVSRTLAGRIRIRQLLRNVRRSRRGRPRAPRHRRLGRRSAGGRAELSGLATALRARSQHGWFHVCDQRRQLHNCWHGSGWIFRRHAPRRSAGFLDPALGRAARARPELDLASPRRPLAVYHRPSKAGRQPSESGSRGEPRIEAVVFGSGRIERQRQGKRTRFANSKFA